MTTIIYTFTGTGNTLAVARQLADALGDTTIIPITQAMKGAPLLPEAETADAIGFAFPVYYVDMPPVVKKCVQGLQIHGNPYLFGVATCGGSPGAPSTISMLSSRQKAPISPLAQPSRCPRTSSGR